MYRPVHFEIVADDPQRASGYHERLLGWKAEVWSGEGPPYWLVTTGPVGVPGIDGGIMQREFPRSVIPTVEVESLPEYLWKVEAAGGKVVTQPRDIPGVGTHTYCADPDGNLFGLLQPVPRSERRMP